MKKLISLLILLALILPLLACGTEIEKEEPAGTSMFVVVEETAQWTVVYHRQTKVMYVFTERYTTDHGGTRSGFTVLLDADGMPLLWNGE